MKKTTLISVLFGLITANIMAQQPTEVVKKFGTAMQQWCNTDEIEYHEQALKLASGKIKCLVDDRVTQDAVANDPSQLLTNGTQEMMSYLNIFQNAIIQGQKYEMSNIRVRTDFTEPTAFKNETPPSFVSADLALSGKLVYNITDIFYIRDGKITKIIDYSSENSVGKALELYSKGKKEEAFKMFRKLAYADWGNVDAQYYLTVMEINKEGCDFLDKKIRDKEALWFMGKNVLGANRETMILALKFKTDESKLDYYGHSHYLWLIRYKKPISSGLMVSFDKKTNTYGFQNEKRKLVIPYNKYKMAYPFHDGRALVYSKNTEKCGFIDENGNEAVPIIYQYAISDFYKGRTWCVKDNIAYLIDNQGKVLKMIPGYERVLFHQPVGRYAMLLKTGINEKEQVFDIYDYNGNLCYEDYTSWNWNSRTGVVTMEKEGSPSVQYKIEW